MMGLIIPRIIPRPAAMVVAGPRIIAPRTMDIIAAVTGDTMPGIVPAVAPAVVPAAVPAGADNLRWMDTGDFPCYRENPTLRVPRWPEPWADKARRFVPEGVLSACRPPPAGASATG